MDGNFRHENLQMSVRIKIVIAIVILSACGVGVWALIQNALRATTGHS
jgi:hypothetical protein